MRDRDCAGVVCYFALSVIAANTATVFCHVLSFCINYNPLFFEYFYFLSAD